MNFLTTAIDCHFLINHFQNAKERFLKKAKQKDTPLAMKARYNGRIDWLDKRIDYYTAKKQRLEMLE